MTAEAMRRAGIIEFGPAREGDVVLGWVEYPSEYVRACRISSVYLQRDHAGPVLLTAACGWTVEAPQGEHPDVAREKWLHHECLSRETA